MYFLFSNFFLSTITIVFRRHACHHEQHDDEETYYIEYALSHSVLTSFRSAKLTIYCERDKP